jgi:hypothetical protein
MMVLLMRSGVGTATRRQIGVRLLVLGGRRGRGAGAGSAARGGRALPGRPPAEGCQVGNEGEFKLKFQVMGVVELGYGTQAAPVNYRSETHKREILSVLSES